jgi:hypothetical protein
MKTLLWRGKSVHVWFNELPDWTYEVLNVNQRRLSTTKRYAETVQQLAIEMILPGPKADYGALGAVFVPDDTQLLQVEVSVTNDQGDIVTDSLARIIDRVRKGFPEEYVTGFLDGIMQYEPLQTLGGGTLSFCCALHGEIGSSIWFFQVIGRVIINLLTHQLSSLSDEDLVEIIQKSIRPS